MMMESHLQMQYYPRKTVISDQLVVLYLAILGLVKQIIIMFAIHFNQCECLTSKIEGYINFE